jgi:hypothetical protein
MDRKENSIMADIPIDELDFEEQPERPDDSWTYNLPEDCDESTQGEAKAQPLYIGHVTIDDAINMHLVDCVQCRDATERCNPIGLGQNSKHCAQYWHLQLLRARYEGKVNNIVAHTELGDEAPKRGQLE